MFRMIDFTSPPVPEDDGQSHINTHRLAGTKLGQMLYPGFNPGAAINHPLIGPFHSVENLWCYLNTGGMRDKLRTMEPAAARNIVRLSDKYSCDKYRELTVDMTLLKIQSNTSYMEWMTQNELPFDHYYIKGTDRMPIRPSYSSLFISILHEVRDIVQGRREHEFVRFKDMYFTKLKA